jgi:hypothetical protein
MDLSLERTGLSQPFALGDAYRTDCHKSESGGLFATGYERFEKG